MSAIDPTRIDLLELDIDVRLAELWMYACDTFHDEALDTVGRFMRAAYGIGYNDATLGDRSLYTEHGYLNPGRAA